VHGSRKQELKQMYDEKKATQSSENMKAIQDPEKRQALHYTVHTNKGIKNNIIIGWCS
jgi:hypothetical protein